jgi:hypothetical protein
MFQEQDSEELMDKLLWMILDQEARHSQWPAFALACLAL